MNDSSVRDGLDVTRSDLQVATQPRSPHGVGDRRATSMPSRETRSPAFAGGPQDAPAVSPPNQGFWSGQVGTSVCRSGAVKARRRRQPRAPASPRPNSPNVPGSGTAWADADWMDA